MALRAQRWTVLVDAPTTAPENVEERRFNDRWIAFRWSIGPEGTGSWVRDEASDNHEMRIGRCILRNGESTDEDAAKWNGHEWDDISIASAQREKEQSDRQRERDSDPRVIAERQSKLLYTLRTNCMMTQTQMAILCGCSQPQWSRYERGVDLMPPGGLAEIIEKAEPYRERRQRILGAPARQSDFRAKPLLPPTTAELQAGVPEPVRRRGRRPSYLGPKGPPGGR